MYKHFINGRFFFFFYFVLFTKANRLYYFLGNKNIFRTIYDSQCSYYKRHVLRLLLLLLLFLTTKYQYTIHILCIIGKYLWEIKMLIWLHETIKKHVSVALFDNFLRRIMRKTIALYFVLNYIFFIFFYFM